MSAKPGVHEIIKLQLRSKDFCYIFATVNSDVLNRESFTAMDNHNVINDVT